MTDEEREANGEPMDVRCSCGAGPFLRGLSESWNWHVTKPGPHVAERAAGGDT